MVPLQFTFNKPPFEVKEVALCPFENKRGLVTFYNFVAVGQTPNEQVILASVPAEMGSQFAHEQLTELERELAVH